MLTQLKSWLWRSRRLDADKVWTVLQHFETPEKVYFADPGEYALIPKLGDKHRKALENKSLADIDAILADCDAGNVSILTWTDAEYPERLRNIDCPPPVLYYRGKLPRMDEEIAIAMAGTRKATVYGKQVAGELAFQITRLGGLIVTGVVEGCDEHALRAALKAGGPVVCVLAGGVDVPYYNSDYSRHLMADVATCGVLVSEYPPGMPHLADHFLARNRILTGLSIGTVCVEAPVRSGTLNVARLALEQGRDVYAVPTNIHESAGMGTNQLLVRGEAICVCSGADVLEHYWALFPHKRKDLPALTHAQQTERLQSEKQPAPVADERKPAPVADSKRELILSNHKSEFTDDEIAILNALAQDSKVADEIIGETGLPARRVTATLTVLTIRGLVKQLPGGRYEGCVRLI